MANTGLLCNGSEGCKWPHQQNGALYIRFFIMGYFIWPNGGRREQSNNSWFKQPGPPPQKKDVQKQQDDYWLLLFSQEWRNCFSNFRHKITKILTIFSRGRNNPTLPQEVFHLSDKHEDGERIWKESEETEHTMLNLRWWQMLNMRPVFRLTSCF